MPKLERGRIIEAEVLDQQGRNPKRRRLVIITPTEEIEPGKPLVAVSITGTLPRPLTDEFVLLPFHPKGHPRTGLSKRSAAKCDWLCPIQHDDVLKISGIVPTAEVLEILEKVDALHKRSGGAPAVE